jgi:hypothetical protein
VYVIVAVEPITVADGVTADNATSLRSLGLRPVLSVKNTLHTFAVDAEPVTADAVNVMKSSLEPADPAVNDVTAFVSDPPSLLPSNVVRRDTVALGVNVKLGFTAIYLLFY